MASSQDEKSRMEANAGNDAMKKIVLILILSFVLLACGKTPTVYNPDGWKEKMPPSSGDILDADAIRS